MLTKEESRILVKVYRKITGPTVPFMSRSENETRILYQLDEKGMLKVDRVRAGMVIAFLTPEGKRLGRMINRDTTD
jgi:hypothetical protein